MKLKTRQPVNHNQYFEGRLESFRDGRLMLDLASRARNRERKWVAPAARSRRLKLMSPTWRRRIWCRKSRRQTSDVRPRTLARSSPMLKSEVRSLRSDFY